MNPRAVLFDLDGTLLDTAPDLAAALNALRTEQGLQPLDYAHIRPQVSNGSAAVVELGFSQVGADRFEVLRQRFLQLYGAALAVHTRPFDGFDTVLDELDARGLKWGVVTNKPAFLTDPLLRQLDLDRRCACVISGDTLPQRKPHPAQLLHAAKLMDLEPATCLYVGDARRDVEAAQAAGMPVLVATFGYLTAGEDVRQWQPDGLIGEPADLLQWLDRSH